MTATFCHRRSLPVRGVFISPSCGRRPDRVDGTARHHYRLFCLLERDGASLGLGAASTVLITGKGNPTERSAALCAGW